MAIREFALERFFAKHEFAVKHVLGASDIEPMTMSEVLALADGDTRALWDGLRLGYTESMGLPALRAEIATMYEGLSAANILTFAGANEAIYLAMHASLSPGDHAVVVWPAYQSLHEVARAIGADVTLLPLRPADWSLDVEALIAAIRPNTRIVVINSPHNPTGAQLDRSELDAIVAVCTSRGITLFSDEVYRLLEHDPSTRLPPAAALSDRALSLGVMSKSFALAGLRMGWLATRDLDLLARIAALKDYTTICSSAPSEILALIALRARDRVIARSQSIVSANLPPLRDFMRRHADVLSWIEPRAGSTCFPRFVGDVDAETMAERLIAETGVLVVPGGRFGYERPYFRLGYGRRDMGAALEAIEPVLASMR